MTPPTTVRDLRARVRARNLPAHVVYERLTGGPIFDCRIMVWPREDVVVTFEGPRLRCLELAWRLVQSEGSNA
jgi:hypothetical protein